MAITTNNLISRQTVGSAGAASITFSNIPQTFTDLRVVVSSRCDQAGVAPVLGKINFNGSTTTYTYIRIYGDGSSAATSSGSAAYFDNVTGTGATANTFGSDDIYISNYTSANYKTYSSDTVLENNGASAHTALYCGLWSTVSAITSLSVYPGSGNYTEFTTASLYGISSSTSTQNTSVPSATGGDVITTDGTYWYHAFIASGTFTPLKALTADCLVVAGGGGSGYAYGAGGGAGGLLYNATTAFASGTAHTMTIGAGGNNGTNASRAGVVGNNSTITATGFTTLTANGGGGGGYNGNQNGGNGGSGGGASVGGGNNQSGGTATSGQGNAGGAGTSGNTGGSGGGGASAVGAVVVGNQTGGNGGVGSSAYSSWGSATLTGELVSSTYYYAGGGGGSSGNGGSGGGGYGANYAGTATIPNTGGGGGGDKGSGGGGSGIVLIRYVV